MPCMKKHCHALTAFSVVSVKMMYSMTVIISTVMLLCVQSELGFYYKISLESLQPFQILRINIMSDTTMVILK